MIAYNDIAAFKDQWGLLTLIGVLYALAMLLFLLNKLKEHGEENEQIRQSLLNGAAPLNEHHHLEL